MEVYIVNFNIAKKNNKKTSHYKASIYMRIMSLFLIVFALNKLILRTAMHTFYAVSRGKSNLNEFLSF